MPIFKTFGVTNFFCHHYLCIPQQNSLMMMKLNINNFKTNYLRNFQRHFYLILKERLRKGVLISNVINLRRIIYFLIISQVRLTIYFINIFLLIFWDMFKKTRQLFFSHFMSHDCKVLIHKITKLKKIKRYPFLRASWN